jgi:glycerol-3-phosphate dehydrogenase (NAD(P)+)
MAKIQRFGIIGGGAWGTALAAALRRAGRDVLLWAREPEVVTAINSQQINMLFLPGVKLDPAIKATGDLSELAGCDVWLLVAPVQHTRSICRQLAQLAPPPHPDPLPQGERVNAPILICAKGIEQQSLALPSMIVQTELPRHPLAILSGPTFAAEVAHDHPTALTLACADHTLATYLASAISSLKFRPYVSDDVIGAQIGGAIKNVLAIACGIVAGYGLGDNTRAALITRGLAELMRLGTALGAKPETLMGLSGLGDLVLTCGSTQSRNMSLGYALGQGKLLADILGSRASVAEGVTTAAAAVALAERHGVDVPIVSAVDQVLNHGAAVPDMIAALLNRPLKAERS